jgi:hypothetical protein
MLEHTIVGIQSTYVDFLTRETGTGMNTILCTNTHAASTGNSTNLEINNNSTRDVNNNKDTGVILLHSQSTLHNDDSTDAGTSN